MDVLEVLQKDEAMENQRHSNSTTPQEIQQADQVPIHPVQPFQRAV